MALTTLLLLAVKAEAQVGFHAGYSPQTLSVKVSNVIGDSLSTIRYQGFFGGVHYNFDITDNLDTTTPKTGSSLPNYQYSWAMLLS